METAIKKAIEGGFEVEKYGGNKYMIPKERISQILLDPLFWQALGKAEKWNWFCNDCGEEQNVQEKGSAYCETCGLNTIWKRGWIIKWHFFIDHLAEGKSAKDFFKELLNDQTT